MGNSFDNRSELSQQLTSFLRTKLAENVSISGDIKRLQGGFDTDTLGLTILNAPAKFPSDLVLRHFRHAHEVHRVIRESTVQNAAACGGHAVPRVPIDSVGELLLNRPFLLMERLPGSNMGETIFADQALIPRFPGIMANLQYGLHRLDPTKLMHHLGNSGVDVDHMKPTRLLGRITAIAEAAQAPDLIEISDWLNNNYPKQHDSLSICHGDLHPNNILMHNGEVSGLIDWGNAMFTDPEYDIAVTKTILSIAPPLTTSEFQKQRSTICSK